MLGVLACVLNLSFLMEALLPGRADVGSTVVSDLSVPGSPWSWGFRLADVLSALCLLTVCGLAVHARRPAWGASARAWLLGWLLTGLFASSTVVAAVVTETCAPATDPRCPTTVGTAAAQDLVHDVVSSVGSACGVLAALVFTVALRRRRWLSALHGGAFALAATSGLVFVVLQAQSPDHLSGWAQRVQIVALSGWFVVLGRTAPSRLSSRAASSPDDRREKMRA